MTLIRSIDFETTGIPSEADSHAIVEIGWVDLTLADTGKVVMGETFSTLCNPSRPIPHEAMAVHHITDAMVAEAAGNVSLIMGDEVTYYCAHNADYERQFFDAGVPYICTYKVALRLWPEASSHSLQFLRYHLSLPVATDRAQPPHPSRPRRLPWRGAHGAHSRRGPSDHRRDGSVVKRPGASASRQLRQAQGIEVGGYAYRLPRLDRQQIGPGPRREGECSPPSQGPAVRVVPHPQGGGSG